MRNFTDSELIKRVQSLPSFDGWQRGMYDVCVRSQADSFNLFDDKAFLYWVNDDGHPPLFLFSRKVTTNAGAYGLKHFDDYNRAGCAVLASDQLVYRSHKHGLHHGREAYVQTKPFPYYRDPNRNKRAEELGQMHLDIIGANEHRAGQHSTYIDRWSTGCIVTADEPAFLNLLAFMRANDFIDLSVCILREF